jgi:hypothetical protein
VDGKYDTTGWRYPNFFFSDLPLLELKRKAEKRRIAQDWYRGIHRLSGRSLSAFLADVEHTAKHRLKHHPAWWDKVVLSGDFKRSIMMANVIAERLNNLESLVSLEKLRMARESTRLNTWSHRRRVKEIQLLPNWTVKSFSAVLGLIIDVGTADTREKLRALSEEF